MITKTAKIIHMDGHGTRVAIDATNCTLCTGMCGQPKIREVLLPGNFRSEIELSMSLGDQLVVLFHSLLLPLIGFVVGASISWWLALDELIIIGGSVLGLLVGIMLCVKQSSGRINFIEKAINE